MASCGSILRGGLGIAALCYVGVDYVGRIAPWHATLQPLLWLILALAAICRAPFYPHWSTELKSALPFLGSLLFMIAAVAFEATCVHFVTAVLGLDWHRTALPLPDTGQWLFLALNEKLPMIVVQVLRAPLIGLHHYLMLFLMLAFSVLFDCVKAPGLGLGARYMFTMAVGRLLRVMTFVSTILPSARPWCATARFEIPNHPHPWAQKYYMPYASDPIMIRQLLRHDMSYDIGIAIAMSSAHALIEGCPMTIDSPSQMAIGKLIIFLLYLRCLFRKLSLPLILLSRIVSLQTYSQTLDQSSELKGSPSTSRASQRESSLRKAKRGRLFDENDVLHMRCIFLYAYMTIDAFLALYIRI